MCLCVQCERVPQESKGWILLTSVLLPFFLLNITWSLVGRLGLQCCSFSSVCPWFIHVKSKPELLNPEYSCFFFFKQRKITKKEGSPCLRFSLKEASYLIISFSLNSTLPCIHLSPFSAPAVCIWPFYGWTVWGRNLKQLCLICSLAVQLFIT